jgi:hypothetical protein
MIALDALIQAHEPLRYCTKPGSRFASGRAAARRSPKLQTYGDSYHRLGSPRRSPNLW